MRGHPPEAPCNTESRTAGICYPEVPTNRPPFAMTAAHWHLVLNHIPFLGLLFGTGVLLYGLWGPYQEVQKASLALLAIAGLSTLAVYLTGEPAEEVVEGLAGVSHDALEAHEELGLITLAGGLVTGFSALGALLYGWVRQSLARWTVMITLAVAVVSIGLLAYTSNLGGKISHPELRQGAAQTTVEGAPETNGDMPVSSESEDENDENE